MKRYKRNKQYATKRQLINTLMLDIIHSRMEWGAISNEEQSKVVNVY